MRPKGHAVNIGLSNNKNLFLIRNSIHSRRIFSNLIGWWWENQMRMKQKLLFYMFKMHRKHDIYTFILSQIMLWTTEIILDNFIGVLNCIALPL